MWSRRTEGCIGHAERGIRLCDRRRRLSRLCAGQSPERGWSAFGAAARIRRLGSLDLHSDAQRAVDSDEQEKYAWRYHSEPEPQLGGRRIYTPRGKVLGGSSSINGLVYVRGNALDFDHWEMQGATGWGYRHVLPYFPTRRALPGRRRCLPRQCRTAAHALWTLRNPLHQAWLTAASQAGYPATTDINGFQQEGFRSHGHDRARGPALQRCERLPAAGHATPQSEVRTHALATKILFDGLRASGVHYLRGDTAAVATARREVILAAGSINSPQLLKLSGVGPGAELAEHGIPVVRNLAGVGENLQDHLEFYFQVACRADQPVFGHEPHRQGSDRRALAAAARRPRRDQSF
jgi:choline dehydrogenase